MLAQYARRRLKLPAKISRCSRPARRAHIWRDSRLEHTPTTDKLRRSALSRRATVLSVRPRLRRGYRFSPPRRSAAAKLCFGSTRTMRKHRDQRRSPSLVIILFSPSRWSRKVRTKKGGNLATPGEQPSHPAAAPYVGHSHHRTRTPETHLR